MLLAFVHMEIYTSFFFLSFMPHSKPTILWSLCLARHAKIKAGEALPSLSSMFLGGARADRTSLQARLDRVDGEVKTPPLLFCSIE